MMRTHRHPFGALWHEVNQMQEEFTKLLGRLDQGGYLPGSGGGPRLNVWEDENAVFVEADMPGADAAKLDIQVTEGNQLAIQGERAAPEIAGAVWIRQERPVGSFTKTVRLPALVDADKVEAKYENGVLRLTLPKHEAAKPRKINVTTGN